jgi:hypothetical protein
LRAKALALAIATLQRPSLSKWFDGGPVPTSCLTFSIAQTWQPGSIPVVPSKTILKPLPMDAMSLKAAEIARLVVENSERLVNRPEDRRQPN